ncbi:MAG: Chemotaxis response regulator protein-glutamate methylesterase [Gammaproteobacteria bacterium]|nr:Chemotaxis response regulator protein-glutamate methylesterase [Gammaproteobacteria bacterium]
MAGPDHANIIRVLFVEDDADTADVVMLRLATYTHARIEVTHCSDLRSALAALGSGDFDAVLADLNLPDSHGIRTVKRLLEVRRYIPVVVLSVLSDDEFVLKAVECGAQEYLVKGQVDGAAIVRTIRQAIQRKQAEIKLRRMAHYDGLTGLANRDQFRKRLEHALANAARNHGSVGLMMIDLDRFKTVNDGFGHMAGDQLLVTVAQRLRACLRKSDKLARLGGDEFTVILERLHSLEEAEGVAQRIIEEVSEPFVVERHEIYITPSIGITIYPGDGDSAESLMKNADAAMYEVKGAGRNGYKFFTPGMSERSGELRRMEGALRLAIEQSEFILHYQPRVSLQTSRLQGVEALVRWQRPDTTLIPPAEFIPVAEETGLIIALGEWVVHKALEQVRQWLDSGLPATRVAVNISAQQFRKRNLAAMIADALKEARLGGEYLEIEITESLLMEDTAASVATLQRLKDFGVSIAIDDFGTGHSSLHYLKRFPIDTLKIDRSFIGNLPNDHDDCTITTAIIGLAHNLGLTVVAEGVETREQVNFLRERQCDEAQGFLFSAALNTSQLTAYLQRERDRPAAPQLSLIKGNT